MVQIHGSGASNTENTAMVTNDQELLVKIAGSIVIGSVTANVDSVYIQSGANMIGSVGITHIDNPQNVGSYTIQTIIGSIAITNTGSVRIQGVGSVSQIASPRTYPSFDIIRKSAGSPATNFVLGGVSRSLLIDNLGSNLAYFNFEATANPVNSGTGLLNAGNSLALDLEIGSISIQSSGATVTEMQVISLR